MNPKMALTTFQEGWADAKVILLGCCAEISKVLGITCEKRAFEVRIRTYILNLFHDRRYPANPTQTHYHSPWSAKPLKTDLTGSKAAVSAPTFGPTSAVTAATI